MVLTTHSQLFLTPQAEGAFIKMVKKSPRKVALPLTGNACLWTYQTSRREISFSSSAMTTM